jgi:type IV secretion system protein VirD4
LWDYLRHPGPEHVLCYAPTRSGKEVGLIVPTLLSWRQSVFVTDLKGELYELSSRTSESLGTL